MNIFTKLDFFWTLYVYEVYEYYDIPIVFSCINEIWHKFLSMLLTNNDWQESRMCMEISENRLTELKKQTLSLKDVFKNAETTKVIILTGNGFSDSIMWLDYMSSNDIDDSLLPNEEYRFIVPEDKAYLAIQELISLESNQRGREVMYMRIIGDWISHWEMAINWLSKFLDLCQWMINSIALWIENSMQSWIVSQKGKIPNMITNEVKLVFSGCYAWSFGIKVLSTKNVGMFKSASLLSKSFDVFKNIVTTHDLDNAIGGLRHRPIKKMTDFFDFLADSKLDLDIGYAFPNDGIDSLLLNAERSNILWIALKETAQENSNIIETKGILRGIELDKKTFTIHDETDHKDYHWQIDEAILWSDAIQKAVMNKKYIVQLIEKVEQTDTEQIKITYTLSNISYETI